MCHFLGKIAHEGKLETKMKCWYVKVLISIWESDNTQQYTVYGIL